VTHPTEPDNAPAWDGRNAGHYEVWYLTFNDLPSRCGFWIRYTLEAPRSGPPYARLWFAAFDAGDAALSVALNRRYPIGELSLQAAPFAVDIAGSALRHDGARGRLQGGGHDVRWDLAWDPPLATHRHLPDLVYRTRFADTRVLSPGPRIALRGTVEVDGRRFDLAGAPGGQTHLWGRKHAHAWAWGRCSAFDDGADAFVEALTVRVRRAGLVLPAVTLLAVHLDGAVMLFTGLRSALRARGHFATGRYAFSAASGGARVEGEFTCGAGAAVQAEYADPDGERCFCANTEVGNLALLIRRRGLPDRRLVARGTAHFETARRAPWPGVRPHAPV
jgi:hypothetical protein